MTRWTRARYLPNLPLGENGRKITACAEHLQLARKTAREGMVLLKNEVQKNGQTVLPLEDKPRLALFGKAVFDYVKGGGGSGDVTVSHVKTLYDGLTEAEAAIFEPLAEYYRKDTQAQYEAGAEPGRTVEPALPADLLQKARVYTDTAVIAISRFSGEGWDRQAVAYPGESEYEAIPRRLGEKIFPKGDFYLTDQEQAMVDQVKATFPRTVVVLNVGGMVDTSWFVRDEAIPAVLLAWQGGMEGGLAMADLLLGKASPSGKLPDTFASGLDDYPSTRTFHDSPEYVEYLEDIYVGYRYFETHKGAAEKVNYPFGHGLSYTTFSVLPLMAGERAGEILVNVQVKNTGTRPGKEVVQLYYSAPQGMLGKPKKSLAAFAKTRELAPQESQILTLTFPVFAMASYDDLGKIRKSAWILEQGSYTFFLGTSVRDGEVLDFVYEQSENQVTEQLTEKLSPRQLPKRLLADGTYENLPQTGPFDHMENGLGWPNYNVEGEAPIGHVRGRYFLFNPAAPELVTLDMVAEGKKTLEQLMAQMSDEDLADLLGGQPNTGVADTFGFGNLPEYGVPSHMTADGPAGLRVKLDRGVCATAWPCSTMLASTWNPDLVKAVGCAGAKEVKENNISFWLTPAVNIHRSPLCGRNFEYYSEDPYLAGTMAAAMVKGIQSQRIGASLKHFACNNKETRRKNSDSRVSERALREIYLKPFEIIVKTADPWTVMTSYNLINGQRASENKDLITGVLREEWSFAGAVTTDWWTKGEQYKEVLAGNDLKMGTGYADRLLEAREKGLLTREDLEVCARRVLQVLLRLE